MNTGKLILFGCLLLFTIACSPVQSQTTLPVAVPVPDGVWVFLGNELPKNFNYVIERKLADRGNYEKAGEVKAPASIVELNSRQQLYQNHFSKLDPLSMSDINRLWQYINQQNAIEKFYSENIPMTHLLAGTAFFDSKANANSNYKYRISKQTTNGQISDQKESNATAQFRKPEFPEIKFSTSQSVKDKVSIIWSVKDQKSMTHFNIYRSVFGKDDFVRMPLSGGSLSAGVYSEKDSLKFIVIDSIGIKPAWYEYQIAPVDAFGIEGPMQGLTNGGNIVDYYAPPITEFRSVNTHKNHEIKLMWKLEHKRYLNGITVMRSRSYDTGYTRIASLPISDSVYTDIVPESGENFYYYLQLESPDNTPLTTAKIFAIYTDDHSLPEPPNEIDAATVPNGINVYWKCEDPFANGFFVYRRKNTTDPFVQISSLIPSGQEVYSYNDTSRLLQGGEVYEYVVKTRNQNNQLSRNSDTISASPGIKVTLTAPMNLRYRNHDGVITLIWDNMISWDNDLLGYNVYRSENKSGWVKVNKDSLDPARNFFVDSSTQSMKTYSYAVSSFDMYGNQSSRSTIELPTITEELLPPPPGIQVSQTEGSVYITWGQMEGDVSSVNIYRSEPGKRSVLIGSTENGSDSYIDKTAVKGKLYFYQLSSVNKNKKEGIMSEKSGIRLH